MSDLSAVLEAGLSLEEVHKFLSEGMSLSEISAAVGRLRARGEAVTEPEEEEPSGRKTALNIAALEAELGRLGISVRFDQIRHEMTVSGVPPQYNPETAAQDLPVLLHDTLKTRYRCTKDLLTDLLGVIAGKHRFNPVLDLLNSSQWDGESRLLDLFQILGICPEDGLSQTLVWKWCLQAAALLENPAHKPFGADGVLVLQGPQGCGKTSFVRKLGISPEFTRLGQYFDPKDKDTTRRCVSCWICELGEVETTLRGDLERLKAFLTAETDVYRVPYGRTDCQYIRRTSFIATCNSSAFLIDPTGSRRFWTVPVQQIDLERLQDFDSLQFWLEVRASVASGGQSFRLTREEQAQLAQRNAAHEKPLKAQPEIEDIFTLAEQKPDLFSWEYVTVSRLKIENETLKAFSVEQIGKALDKLGIVAERKSIDGKQQRVRRLPVRTWNN